MNELTGPASKAADTLPFRIAGGVMAAAIAFIHIIPRSSWLALIVITGTLAWLLWRDGWMLNQAKRPTATSLGLVAFGSLAVLGAAWAAVPALAVHSGLVFIAQVVLATVGADAAARLPNVAIRRLSEGLLIGVAVGVAYLLVDGATRLSIYRLFFETLAYLAPGYGQDTLALSERLSKLGPSDIKRNMAEAALLIWPVLLIAWRGNIFRRSRGVAFMILAIVALAGVLINHDSSLLAMALGLAVLTGAKFAYRATWPAVAAIWCILNLLLVPAALWQFHAKLYLLNWIQFSARARMVIWGYSAEQILKSPVLGIGAGSGAVLDARQTHFDLAPGSNFPLSTANHQHDIFLQTWYEMGGLGALVLCATGLVALWRLRKLPDPVRGYGLAAFASTMGMISTSYGLWQEWFQASIAISAIALVIAIRAARVEAFDIKTRS